MCEFSLSFLEGIAKNRDLLIFDSPDMATLFHFFQAPATVGPVMRSADNLPLCVQVVAKRGNDKLCIALALAVRGLFCLTPFKNFLVGNTAYVDARTKELSRSVLQAMATILGSSRELLLELVLYLWWTATRLVFALWWFWQRPRPVPPITDKLLLRSATSLAADIRNGKMYQFISPRLNVIKDIAVLEWASLALRLQ
ncbi:hypothetical protein MRX96_039050 [Rhipicephalus microplus]